MQGRGFMQIAGGRKFPGPWIAPNWTRDPATGLWSNVPVEGGEVLTNGNFAAWTGDNPDSWTLVAVEDANNYITENPAGKANIVSNNAVAIGMRPTSVSFPNHTWFVLRFDLTVGLAGGRVFANLSNLVSENIESSGAIVRVGRSTAANSSHFSLYRMTGVASNSTYDNVSEKPLTMSSLLALRNMGRSTIASWGAPVIVPVGYHGGVIGWATPDGLNFICARHNRINVVLEKVVNGTPTVLVNAAAAYTDSLLPTIVRTAATTFQVWYDGAQVGADQTISDAGIINNTWFGLFSTGSGTVGDPVVT